MTRLLYVTPELVMTETFRRTLETIYNQGELSRIAIDEAHCISEWGHDFRPAYYHLSHFRLAYPTVPIICLTATAPPSVRADIIKTLGLNPGTTKSFVASTTRRNLVYEVRFTSDVADNRFLWLLSWLQKIYTRRANDPTRSQEISKENSANNQRSDAISGIIYVPYRSDCDTLSARFREHNIGAAPYHAGLSNLERNECQNKWIASAPGYDIIIATTAFGMGIDKQDVRFVVHWYVHFGVNFPCLKSNLGHIPIFYAYWGVSNPCCLSKFGLLDKVVKQTPAFAPEPFPIIHFSAFDQAILRR